MNGICKSIAAGAATLAAAVVFAAPASAGCGPEIERSATSSAGGAAGGARMIPADFTARSIVGMWGVTFTDANNNVIDFGYQQWHSDGTEILNSGGRAPATENFCLGVWTQVGQQRYALNHFALGYDASSGKLNAKINIKEDVIVAKDDASFSGPFTIDVYDPANGKRLQRVTGTVTGQRITVR